MSQVFTKSGEKSHDEDNSILRRGIPVAHSIYGVASTINAANYVMIIALEKTLELGHPMGMEIYWRDNFHCPSEEEYKEMTVKKTGGLFMLAIRLMQLFSENKSDFSKLSAILVSRSSTQSGIRKATTKYFVSFKITMTQT
ncbi:hypothetical protein MSG28_002670 [Choristoneura fumiferana]|uniref:Uncharacterized protein n=1 Tax=Choristoneura fumiferana TaxID=7141 RepID=A0ACC0JIX0_CHOFU|nr:hypothetical protein MSG28_002670 [Choristoneura fumiferana]